MMPNHSDMGQASPVLITNTNGAPSAITFNDGLLYIADSANQSIMKMDPDNNEIVSIRNEFRGKTFIGPNGIVSNSKGFMYFTDSGPFGETSLENASGSVYCLSADGKSIQTLAHKCLASPSGIIISPQNENVIFVAETMKNRILRFVHVNGAFYCSVFHQLSGSVGPMALTCDEEGNIYVGMFEFKDMSNEGRILILQPNGILRKEIIVENVTEITGLAYKRGSLFICEGSSVYQYELEHE